MTTPKALTLLARKAQFRSAHFYDQPAFSPQKNHEIFGACYSKHGHGHTYSIEVYFSGEIDPLTGMIINLTEIDALIGKVLEPLNDKHLNLEVAAFKEIVPTTENLAHYIFSNLKTELSSQKHLRGVRLEKLRLYESDTLWVDLAE